MASLLSRSSTSRSSSGAGVTGEESPGVRTDDEQNQEEEDRDELALLCVNFVRLLNRCHERATMTRSSQQPIDELDPVVLDKYLYLLEDRLVALREEHAKNGSLPRPLDLDECKRKLDYICEVLRIVPSAGNLQPKTPFNILEHASSSLSLEQKNAERAGLLGAQARESSRKRLSLFGLTNARAFTSPVRLSRVPSTAANGRGHTSRSPSPQSSLRRLSSGMFSSANEDWSSDDRDSSPSMSPSRGHRGSHHLRRRSHALASSRSNAAEANGASVSANTRMNVDRERLQHDQIRDDMVDMTMALKESVKQIHTTLRSDVQILGDIERSGQDNLDEISKQHRVLKQHMSDAARCACGTYAILILVAFTFVLTYLLIKIFPKAY